MNYLDNNTSTTTLHSYLAARDWITSDERILAVEKPGEGNMNVVLRIILDERSFILKQSRPFVQKYQQIEAPVDRIAVEHQFYNVLQNEALAAHLPKILGYDEEEHVLLLQDLGDCEDMSYLYSDRSIAPVILEQLMSAIGHIHRTKVPKDFPQNLEMRRLNHQHIFVLPFLTDNGFQLNDIQEGLQELSMGYKQDEHLKSIIGEIGEKYLSSGDTLLHGDYYPGSWMTAEDHLYIIDPEFGFSGFAEFDLGVMTAHCIMATADERYIDLIFESYEGKAEKTLIAKVAGIEIMRRIIGLAQLPLERTLDEKQYLLTLARKMVLS
ncbi:MAG: S-methyl-5-thioribose kinase [Maribacter sp.]